jgi:hypothetical protein
MAIARQLQGKIAEAIRQNSRKELHRMHSGKYSISDPAGVFSISRLPVYRTLARAAL